ncbi:MAG TPA: hypothetical protein VFW28_11540 [Micropepsaceae bacterium]|nr:hypothetical protein [Micropepsaceae bacterium]
MFGHLLAPGLIPALNEMPTAAARAEQDDVFPHGAFSAMADAKKRYMSLSVYAGNHAVTLEDMHSLHAQIASGNFDSNATDWVMISRQGMALN